MKSSRPRTLWMRTCRLRLLHGENMQAWYLITRTPGVFSRAFHEGNCLAMEPSGCSKVNVFPVSAKSRQVLAERSAMSVSIRTFWANFPPLAKTQLNPSGSEVDLRGGGDETAPGSLALEKVAQFGAKCAWEALFNSADNMWLMVKTSLPRKMSQGSRHLPANSFPRLRTLSVRLASVL